MKHFFTREDARQKIFTYIETYYNRQHVQICLEYLSPQDYFNSKTIQKEENIDVA